MASGEFLGPYRILALLGAGGMGEVYRAQDTKLGREVAIKVLPARLAADADRLIRFEREARALAALNHPHIATIHGIEDAGHTRALVLELVEGETLGDWITRRAPDPRGSVHLLDSLSIARQIAEALEAAHARGIIHRDLKPANVMLTARGAPPPRASDGGLERRLSAADVSDCIVKVLDFGLAKMLDPRSDATAPATAVPEPSMLPTHGIGVTQAGAVVGTAGYMSPEQTRGQDVDERTDIWAFGCVLFELLARRAPFSGSTSADTLAAVLDREPDWNALPPETPPAVRQLLQRCLQKDLARRLHHIGDARIELDDALAALSVRSGASPAATKPRIRWAAATALIAAALLMGIVGWVLIGRRGGDAPRRIEAIAVLPLQNLSGDAEQDYFAEGMTEELMTELARVRELRVISRTSAMRFKGSAKSLREIGRELDVDAIVEGSVLRAGSQARITLKLVEVETDTTLLAESYARELQDVLALQNEIARAVASQIRATVTPQEPSRAARRVVPEAHDHYLRGRSAWNKRTSEHVRQALAHFQQAIERDPSYAAAWAGVADCYIVFSGALLGLSEQEAYPKAREAALKALAIDETLAEAHTSLGSVKNEHDWDWAGAEAEYKRALDLSPNYVTARQWYGEFLSMHGRFDESLVHLRRARELDPFSPVVSGSLGVTLLLARRYDEAIAEFMKTLEIDRTFSGAHMSLGEAYLQKGMHAEAIAELEQGVRLAPGLSRPLAWLGHAHAVAAQPERARALLKQVEALPAASGVSPYDVALIHAGLGSVDDAFAWLERAYGARSWDLVQLQVDMRFDALRADPRFGDLVKRIGLR